MNKELAQKEKELLELAKLFETKKAEYEKAKDKHAAEVQNRLASEKILNNFTSTLLNLVSNNKVTGTLVISIPYRQVGVTHYLSRLSIPGVLVAPDTPRGVFTEDKLRGCSFDTIIFDIQETKRVWNEDFHKRYEKWCNLCNKGKPIKVILLDR